ncbi:MAG: YIP1 family protein [Rhodobacteraceae bacterium]|nr:YIP1 family protein [Paracoccaceae bacterium]
MSLVDDIFAAYRQPRRVLHGHLACPGEGRILVFAFVFGFLTFLARLPQLSAESQLSSEAGSFANQVLILFAGCVFWIPLVLYALATVCHMAVLLFGDRASWQQARLALVWAALVASPLVLLGGVLKVFVSPPMFLVVSLATAVVFLWQWAVGLQVVEFPKQNNEA